MAAMEREFLEKCLAEGMSLSQIGTLVNRDHTTVGYWVKKHGLKAANHDKHAPRGGIDDEVLEILVNEGASIPEMAKELDRSVSTVRYWLKQYGLSHQTSRRRQQARLARAAGLKRAKLECREHGLTEFILEGSGYHRCVKCRSERVAMWRRRAKRRLISAAGGGCLLCGYDKYPGALQFHHLDPARKEFVISRRGHTRSFAEVKAEADKCVLLCANCHAEVEGGVAELPSPAAKVNGSVG
jgi:transposase